MTWKYLCLHLLKVRSFERVGLLGWGLLHQKAILLKSIFICLLCSTYIKSEFLKFSQPFYSSMYRLANGDNEENFIKNLNLRKYEDYPYEHHLLLCTLSCHFITICFCIVLTSFLKILLGFHTTTIKLFPIF